MHRSRILAACALSLALLLSACSGGGSKGDSPGPDTSLADATAAAKAFAAALVAGDPSTVPLVVDSAAGAKLYPAIVKAMGDLTPTIDAGAVKVKGSNATALLRWTWPVTSQKPWQYDAPIQLTRIGEQWQVVWSPTDVEPSLKAGETLALFPIKPARGDVVGARGLRIVTDRPVVRVGIDRTKVGLKQTATSARRLAKVVGIDPAPYVRLVEASGPKSFVEAELYRQDDAPAQETYDGIPGAVGVFGTAPLTPRSGFGSPIIGSVGEVTAELIQQHPDLYSIGDVVGLSGLEERYDAQLRGLPGAVVDAVPPGSDGYSGKERELLRVQAQAGRPLRLSMDVDLQTEAESILKHTAPASAIVAVRPSTGDVLVVANGPSNQGVDVATYGQSAPGSTFKSVSSLALLRAGLTPDSTVPCTSTITVDGKPFKNYSDYPSSALGDIPFRTAVANSCNTAFISQRGRVKPGALASAAESLGFGVDHDTGFPAYFGTVPAPSGETEAAADLIGQGGILASPLTMATVIASIQSGKLVVPRLVDGVAVTPPAGAKPLTGSEANSLRSLLRAVVTDGSGRGLLDVPGPPVIAKTGTAEFTRDGKTLTHAWMIAAQGDLAVCVYVDEGASGSGTAGPLLEQFLRYADQTS